MLYKQIFHTKLYLSTTRKLTNKNKNIDEMFPSEYTTGIIVGKEEIKTNPKSTMKLIKTKKKKYNDVSFIPTELLMVLMLLVKSIRKLVGILCSLLSGTVRHVNYKGYH